MTNGKIFVKISSALACFMVVPLVKTVKLGFEYKVFVHSPKLILPVARCMASPMAEGLPATVPNHTNERHVVCFGNSEAF